MKRFFSKVACIFAVGIFVSSNTVVVYAHEPISKASIVSIDKGRYTVKGVESIWRYRYYHGKKQKRLWSCTDNCWITDHWIDV